MTIAIDFERPLEHGGEAPVPVRRPVVYQEDEWAWTLTRKSFAI
jgi:hypothetical protein